MCLRPLVAGAALLVAVAVASAAPPDTVRHLTVTSRDRKNVLQWVNPPGFGEVTIRYTSGPTDCAYPTMPEGGDGSLFAGDVTGAPGLPASFSHDTPGLTNTHKYCYSLWVREGPSVYSLPRSEWGRPFSTGGLVKWTINLGIFSMVPPGNGAGAVHFVDNDSSIHSATKGDGADGGLWPTSPRLWIPRSMDGPSQGRPSGVPVAIGSARPAIILSSQDGHVYVFDAETGAPGWSPSSPPLAPTVLAHPSGVFTTFGGTKNLVFVGARDPVGSRFYALRLSDGGFSPPGWVFDGGTFGRIGAIHGQAAVDQEGRRVYFASRAFDAANRNTIWCVDLETGAGLWAAAVGDIDTAVTFVGDRLYVGTNAGDVKAIDTRAGHEGQVVWSFALPALEGNAKGYVAVNRLTGDVYFATAGRLWGLGPGGTAKWTPGFRSVDSPSTPVFAPLDAWIYVGGGDGLLHRFSAATGDEDLIAPFPVTLVDAGAVGSPTFDLSAGFVYVGSEGGLVYAIRLP